MENRKNCAATLPQAPTDHPNYCMSENGAFALNDPHRQYRFSTWKDFKSEMMPGGTYDDDRNYVMRFDLADSNDGLELQLFIMHQRRGNFVPVVVDRITQADMPDLTKFLAARWNYHLKLWSEFSGQPVAPDGANTL